MRIAMISDMHGNAVAFEAVVKDLKNQTPDVIVCLGDITMRGPQPAECIEMVKELNPDVLVRGNYDHLFTRFPRDGWKPQSEKEEKVLRAFEYDAERISKQDQEWLANLDEKAVRHFEAVQTELFHAAPDSFVKHTWPWASLEELQNIKEHDETKLVLFGHMHHSFVRQGKGTFFVNGGSIGIPFDQDLRASYGIVDIKGDDIAVQLRRVAYNRDLAIRIAKQLNMPDVEAFEYALTTGEYPYHMKFEKV